MNRSVSRWLLALLCAISLVSCDIVPSAPVLDGRHQAPSAPEVKAKATSGESTPAADAGDAHAKSE